MKPRASAMCSGLALALAGIALHFVVQHSAPIRFDQFRKPSVPTPRLARGDPLRTTPIDFSPGLAGSAEVYRTCRARHTQILQFGRIRLIDVGDDVENLGSFVASQQADAIRRNQPCLVVISLASCPSCAAIGYALNRGLMEHALGPLTVLRIDIEEFAEELSALGMSPAQVPSFALLDAEGKVASILEGKAWPGNHPSEFLPVLSDFLRGQSLHQRGGREPGSAPGSLRL